MGDMRVSERSADSCQACEDGPAGRRDFDAFLRQASLQAQGFERGDFLGKPLIAIVSNWSELSRCHGHFRDLAEAVKRGVWQAGGFPREVPTMPVAADVASPTGISFLHRNLLAMEIEEVCAAYPIAGLVFLGSCDETIPAMLMAAASVNLPAIMLPGGPGINGRWRGGTLGSSTDCHRIFADIRAGLFSPTDEEALSGSIDRSFGHCTTMGTASTMACLAEALGMALPGSAAVPAVDSRRRALAQRVGRDIVGLTMRGRPRPRDILTPEAFHNAVTVLGAIGGSTNAVIHLLALARRCGVVLTLTDIDRLVRGVPTLADVKPAGSGLMEDFFFAGGVPALLHRLQDLLNGDAATVSGRTIQDIAAKSEILDEHVIRPLSSPVFPGPALVVLFGNLAPDGAVLKVSAASSQLLSHTGVAHVFESRADLSARIDEPHLNIQADDILVLRNTGPIGSVGMPELGAIPIPEYLLRRGVRDMVRVSDSRMSGTAYGTIVLHIAPEAMAGGPLGLVESGDTIILDVPRRRLDLRLPAGELAARERGRTVEPRQDLTPYQLLYRTYVSQADKGCDLDFAALAAAGQSVQARHVH
jgi:dihydroxy-acid dehydratase